jgi:crotonobetainyl-CoA:carnitine CoA-transferase CaiB-like acyl-CoA transferase
MGRPELGRDPRFIDNTSRLKNRAAIIKVIEGWLQSIPSDEAAVEALREARIPSAPVLTVEQAMKHPHLVERQTVQTVHDRILGELQVPAFRYASRHSLSGLSSRRRSSANTTSEFFRHISATALTGSSAWSKRVCSDRCRVSRQ